MAVPRQLPLASQLSPLVQEFPSLQPVPDGSALYWHWPPEQLPWSQHAPLALQVIGLPRQLPFPSQACVIS